MVNQKIKIELALKALENHSKKYARAHEKPVIRERLNRFWSTGEALKFDGFCLSKGTELSGWDEDCTFGLHLVSPRWDSMLLTLDDAVVGPIGDWKSAHNYLPIFVGGEQSEFCIVVKLDDELCPVGIFEEPSCLDDDLVDGICMLSPSLDEFLDSLTQFEANVKIQQDEETIKQAYYSLDEYF